MKMGKKIFSFLLVALMCMGTLIIPASAATVPTPVFTLDLSSYDTNQTLKNGVTGPDAVQLTAEEISAKSYTPNGTTGPALKKYYDNKTGAEIRTLQPASDPAVTGKSGSANYLGFVELSAGALTKLFGNTVGSTDKENGDNMTLSFWSKDYGVANSNDLRFSYAGMTLYKYGAEKFELVPTHTDFAVAPTAKTWNFYTISRKWEADTITYNISRNGAAFLKGTYSFANQTHKDNSASNLVIGGSGTTNNFARITYGEIADFSIYDEALSLEQMTQAYNDSKGKFASLSAEENMPTTLAANASTLYVAPEEGIFDVVFNNFIDASTVQAGIKLYKEGCEIPVEGATVTASGMTATVSYDGFDYGEKYKLKINDSLKGSLPGVTTTVGEVTIYTSDYPIGVIGLASDLKKINTGAFPTGTDWYTFVRSNGENSFTVNSMTLQDESTIKYLKIMSEKYNGVSIFGRKVPTEYADFFMLDLKIQVTGSATQRGVYFNEDIAIAGKDDALDIRKYDTDADGFANVRYVFEKIDNTYKVTSIGMIAGVRTEKANVINIPSGWNGYIILKSFHYGNLGGTPTPKADLNVAEFKLSPYNPPSAEGVNTAALTDTADELVLKFNKLMNNETINDTAFVLTDVTANKEVKGIEFVGYDALQRKATLKLHEYLNNGHSYEITFNGIKCEEGFSMAPTAKVAFAVNFGGIVGDITIADTNKSATIQISNITTGGKVKAFLMILDDQGRTVDLTTAETTANGTLALPALAITPTTGYTVKCFAWEETATGYKEISDDTIVIE